MQRQTLKKCVGSSISCQSISDFQISMTPKKAKFVQMCCNLDDWHHSLMIDTTAWWLFFKLLTKYFLSHKQITIQKEKHLENQKQESLIMLAKSQNLLHRSTHIRRSSICQQSKDVRHQYYNTPSCCKKMLSQPL